MKKDRARQFTMSILLQLSIISASAILLSCSDLGDAVTPPDLPGNSALSVNDISLSEGSSGNFTISLNAVSSTDVVFFYFIGGGTATKSIDYTVTNDLDTVTIPAGELSVTVGVTIFADAASEGDETFNITITLLSGATLIDGIGVCTIPGSVPAGVSFATDVRPILQSRCATSGCHGGGSSEGNLALVNASYSQVRNAVGAHGAIIVGNPPNSSLSSLYRSLTSSPPSGIPRMPQTGGFFSTTQQNLIRDWIDQGALDN